ncbi:MAG: hypothetical protein E7551_03015 [Ruminococcaceae bacterium]|nr:hypothetical protein [Oscillospiraceae bacterium]
MTKTKNTKRALLTSALALLMCVSMLIGSTFAWFTDSVTSGSNVIQAGTLDIVMEYWDGDSWEDAEGKVIPFVAADGRTEILWEPGCTYEMAPFRIRNEGNLSAKLLVLLNGVNGDEKLMEAIELKTRVNNIPESVLNGSAGNQLQKFEDAEVGVLYGMPEGNVLFDWSLAGKGETTPGTGHTDTTPEFTVFGHMAEEAGNEYQNLSLEGVSITVVATQQTYETDSFNKYYDKDATYVLPLNTADAFYDATVKGGNYSLDADVEATDGYKTYSANRAYAVRDDKEYTLDLNGHNLTYTPDYNGYVYLYTVAYNSTLTINGNGTLRTVNTSTGANAETAVVYAQSTGNVVINGGNFNPKNGTAAWAGSGAHITINGGSFVSDGEIQSELIYSSGGVIDIYGGFFHNTAWEGRPVNVANANRGTGFINIYGGTFVNFDPTTGGDDPNNIKVADGYKVVSETQANGDIWYTVVAE